MGRFQEYVYSLLERHFPIGQIISEEQNPQQKQKQQALQSLMLHRQGCNHPSFVLSKFPKDKNIKRHLDKASSSFNPESAEFSGKLVGLLALLEECGIIKEKREEEKKEDSGVFGDNGAGYGEGENQHRALVFC